ncbi:MAG: DUF2971 domain-containing protein [Thermodesulfobacteriota bacterium]
MTKLFYHYTDVNGLISILENKEFWLSGIDFLNDDSEGKVVFDKIFNSVEDQATQCKLGHLFNLCINQNRMFATSFSENGDQLSQWRGYCPADGGYSIAFNFEKIEELEICKPSSQTKLKVFKSGQDLLKNGSGQLVFDSCTYSHEKDFEEQVQVVSDFVKDAVQDISQEKFEKMKRFNYHFLSILDLIGDQEKSGKILDFIFRVSHIVALYKNSSFYEENEYRLLYVDKPRPSKPFIRGKKSYPLPYIKAKFDKNAVEEIIIGPTKFKNFAWKGVFDVLNTFNIKAKIKFSEIPFMA